MVGDIVHPPIGSIYHLYTTYILIIDGGDFFLLWDHTQQVGGFLHHFGAICQKASCESKRVFEEINQRVFLVALIC